MFSEPVGRSRESGKRTHVLGERSPESAKRTHGPAGRGDRSSPVAASPRCGLCDDSRRALRGRGGPKSSRFTNRYDGLARRSSKSAKRSHRGAPSGGWADTDFVGEAPRKTRHSDFPESTPSFHCARLALPIEFRTILPWRCTSPRVLFGRSPDPAVCGRCSARVSRPRRPRDRRSPAPAARGWRPSVGPVARSGDLATTVLGRQNSGKLFPACSLAPSLTRSAINHRAPDELREGDRLVQDELREDQSSRCDRPGASGRRNRPS